MPPPRTALSRNRIPRHENKAGAEATVRNARGTNAGTAENPRRGLTGTASFIILIDVGDSTNHDFALICAYQLCLQHGLFSFYRRTWPWRALLDAPKTATLKTATTQSGLPCSGLALLC